MTETLPDSDFPQLREALVKYIVPGKEDLLVVEYQKRGEEDLEFDGLGEELQRAAKHPHTVRATFADALGGFEGEDSDIREACIDLYNRLKGVGSFDKTKQERVEGEELFQKTGGQQVIINGRPLVIKGHPITLAYALGFFLALGLFGYMLSKYVPWPGWLSWFPTIFTGLAFVGILVTSAALVSMRGQVRDPGRAARREKAISTTRERRAERKGTRDNWFKRNMTF